jgi:predicted XRE-type DNA-binding protein
MAHGKPTVTRSTGNVFEDLRVGEPSEALAKSELAALISRELRARGLTQAAAAKVLGIDQPKISEQLRGRLTRFSTERLITFLTRLGRDVEILVREPTRSTAARTGRIQVRAVRPRARGGTRAAAASELIRRLAAAPVRRPLRVSAAAIIREHRGE